jgi:hypothetical protein
LEPKFFDYIPLNDEKTTIKDLVEIFGCWPKENCVLSKIEKTGDP